jgi:formylglycine-generating enzyme required for sulfatase activity
MKKILVCAIISILILLAACQPAVPVVVPQNMPAALPPTVAVPPPAEGPTAAAVPTTAAPPPKPTVEAVKPVNILAFCTIIGKDPKTIVKAGTPINIVWGWSAKTEAQINDFLENSITEVTLDGKIIQGKKVEGILKNQTSGDPEVVWAVEVGMLSPGSHKVTYNVKFKKMVDDGTTTYGPGGKTESSPDQCEIFVEEGPGSGAPASSGTADTPETGSTQVRPADGMVMVYVPAGPFTMGSEYFDVEKPIHEVTLDAFWIDQTEVTNAMFEIFVAAQAYQTDAKKAGKSRLRNTTSKTWEVTSGADWLHPQGPQTNREGLSDHPVVHVSWNDASAYCSWAGGKLPGEAEWEKAARGTDGRTYPWGEAAPDAARLNFADVYLGKSAKDGYLFTVPVGSTPPGASPYGAYDMAGNVWEWTADWFDAYPANTVGDEMYGITYRVIRGGSWFNTSEFVRSAYRYIAIPTLSSSALGFRCVFPK